MNEVAATSSNSEQDEAAQSAAEDIALVERCRRGDTQAYNDLVTKYRNRAYAMIYNMVRNEQDAWDLAQEGFVKAWKSMDKFRGQSSFFTWIYRIMTNVAIDFLRKKQIQSGVEFDDQIGLKDIAPGAMTTPSRAAAPAQNISNAEIRSRIDEAINRLSPEHRTVIVMKEMDGMQYHEIAEVLECSIGTVMSRLFYARKKLQTMLKDVYETL
ncbi:MAG: sigma-70 family RNA polymerase sigma factor [Chthoniobacteraceae bacterium]